MHCSFLQLTRLGLAGAAAIASLTAAGAACADESGTSVYLLGSGGPGTAVMPPVEGVFFANTVYYYKGKVTGGRDFQLNGQIVGNLKGAVTADFPTVLWVPSTNVGGGTFAVGVVAPFGGVDIDASVVATGPQGPILNLRQSDDTFVFGDPLVTAMWGWKSGNTHVQLSTLINVPIGDYKEDGLANLAFHRWAVDGSLAVSWRDEASGWDVSGKAGYTWNGENSHTNYDSGDDFHLEGSVEKIFSPAFSAGVQAYYFDQVSGDGGSGARLGDFKGRVTGVGGTAAYNFMIADKIPASIRFRGFHEFDARNRLEGNSAFLDFSMPLWVPSAAAAPAP